MCWFHKWTKWENYEQPMIVFLKRDINNKVEYSITRQRRHCEKCGYSQDQEVNY